MTNQYEQRFNEGTVELRTSGDMTTIVGYAAVFNRYSENLGRFVERIAPGAFKRVLNRGDDIQAWFNHDASALLGSRSNGTLRLSEDNVGLRYEVDIDPDDPDHQRVVAKIRRGDLRGSSFGFMANASDIEWGITEREYPLRTIKSVSVLRDVGPASLPAYPDTARVGELALRSLSEQIDRPLDEILAADDLRTFLLTEQESAQDDATQPSVSPNAALDDERSHSRLSPLAPRMPRAWFGDYR